jgi:hypothetical protein
MIWKKLKKLIIPFIIIKIAISLFFIFGSDYVSVSRELTNNDNFQQGTLSDTIVRKNQKLIRIVRNDEEKGIIIKVRGKKNDRPFLDNQREMYNPKVD